MTMVAMAASVASNTAKPAWIWRLRRQLAALLPVSVFLLWMSTLNTLRYDATSDLMMMTATTATTDPAVGLPSSSSLSRRVSIKPRLIIHVGPPKTATTTIQETFTSQEWKDMLLIDGVVYTGAFINEGGHGAPLPVHQQLRDASCHRAMSQARATEHTANTKNRTVFDVVARAPCAQKLLQTLKPYRDAGQSLIVSDETLSFRLNKFHAMKQPAAFDWISLKALLAEDWDISVVVGYRRYMDWLPSAKQQVEQWKPGKPRMNKWAANGGKAIKGLFPDYWKVQPGSSGPMPYFYTDKVINMVRPYVDVQIMNMHSKDQSVRTTFLCDSLFGAAPHACQVSKRRDKQKENEKISNKAQTLSYDMLTMAAESIIQARPMPKRHDIVLAAQRYHERTLNQTEGDFPLMCPNQADMEAFLEKSMELEHKVLPAFYAGPEGEQNHRAAFGKAVKRQKYCHIDTATVLKDPRWKEFYTTVGTEIATVV